MSNTPSNLNQFVPKNKMKVSINRPNKQALFRSQSIDGLQLLSFKSNKMTSLTPKRGPSVETSPYKSRKVSHDSNETSPLLDKDAMTPLLRDSDNLPPMARV